ncbi:MAG: hypothetical protein D6816_17045 [Bacteroidetes bacterium]|nr:MAG: hypothetical protein D6816_17045 [Bacteroidota bacterium]
MAKGIKAAVECLEDAFFELKKSLGFEEGIEGDAAVENLISRVEKILSEDLGNARIPKKIRVQLAEATTRHLKQVESFLSSEEALNPEAGEVFLRRALITMEKLRAQLMDVAVKSVQHVRAQRVFERAIEDALAEGQDPVLVLRRFRAVFHRATAGDLLHSPRAIFKGIREEAEPLPVAQYVVHKKTGKVFNRNRLLEEVEAHNQALPEGSKQRISVEDLDVEDPEQFVAPVKQARPIDAATAQFISFKNRIADRMTADPVLAPHVKRLLSFTDEDFQYAIVAALASDVRVDGYEFADEAFATARIIREEVLAEAKSAKESGFPLNIIDNWVAQRHSRELILSKPEEWKRFLLEGDYLDPEMHPDPEASLDAIIENMEKASFSEIFDDFAEFKSPHRQLWFNKTLPDGRSAVAEYLKKWGPPAILQDTFSSIAKTISFKNMHATIGPYPFTAMEDIVERLVTKTIPERVQTEQLNAIRKDVEREVHALHVLMNEERGVNDRVAIGRAIPAMITEGMRRFLSAGLLSNVFMYSLTSDPALAITSLVQTGIASSFWDGVTRFSQGMRELLADEDLQKLINILGVHNNITVGGLMNRSLMASEISEGVTSQGVKKFYMSSTKAAHFVQKYSGTDLFTRLNVDTWAAGFLVGVKEVIDAGGDSLADIADTGLAGKLLAERLQRYGIDDAIFQQWVDAAKASPKKYLDATLIEDPFAFAALQGFLTEEQRFIIGNPDSYTRAFVKGAMFTADGQAPARGTVAGEVVRSFFGFQSMPLTIMRYALGRSMAAGTGPTVAMLAPLATVMYMKMQLQQMLAGRELYGNPAMDPVAFTTLLDQMGVFWWVGSIARGAATRARLGRWDDAVIGDVAGPLLPIATESVARQMKAFAFLLGDGDVDRFMTEEARFIQKNLLNFVPGQNSVIVNMGLRALTGDTVKGHVGSLLGLPAADTMKYDRLIKEGR